MKVARLIGKLVDNAGMDGDVQLFTKETGLEDAVVIVDLDGSIVITYEKELPETHALMDVACTIHQDGSIT